VVHVVDGDTIDVQLDGRRVRVRYIGINTPETKHPKKGVTGETVR
jgi:micrococcal nuclease